MSVNSVVLVGRLTRDPEVKYSTGGHAVANMSVAVNRITKNAQGEYEVDFFPVVAWRKTAEFAGQYLSKGRLVAIEGRIQTRSWVDDRTAEKRTVTEIIADRIQGLDKPADAKKSAAAASDAATSASSDMPPAAEDDPWADE